MGTQLPDPQRWTDLAASGENAEQTIGAAFRRVREATEPSDTTLARLAPRLDGHGRSLALQLAWRIAVIVGVVAATGGLVAAALYGWRIGVRRPASPTAVAAAAEATKDARGAHRGPRPAVVTQPPKEIAAAVAPEPVAVLPRRSPAYGGRRAEEPLLPPPSEAGILADVFRELRSRGDASEALHTLDEYDRHFPMGALKSEARVARAEALLALDRRRDALPLLEGLEQAGFAPTRDVRVARGELLAEAGQCERAIDDFDAVMALGDRDAQGGRALYGRASCRLRAGDVQRAREDLQRYLLTNPDGAFAPAARRALGVSPAP